jgi:hypothetical protein
MKAFIIVAAVLLSSHSFAQIIVTDWKLSADTRYDTIKENKVSRLQERVKIGFTIDANGVVEIIGLATTGPSFNNDWANLKTNNNTEDKVNLAFRNLYLRKVVGKVSVEGGAMSPEPTVGAAGLAASGWMDGVRVKVNTKLGNIKVVAGTLGDFSNPNAFSRKFKGNFLEIELDGEVSENLLSESAIENYDGDAYVREKLTYNLHVLGDRVIKVFAEALVDAERHGVTYEAGSEFDVLKTLAHKYENRLELNVYYSHIDKTLPNRSQTITSYFTDGDRVSAQLGGRFDHDGNVTWLRRASVGEKKRFDMGLNLKFANKK